MDRYQIEPVITLLDELGRIAWLDRIESGFAPEEVIGKPFWTWYDERDATEARRVFALTVAFRREQSLLGTVFHNGRAYVYRSRFYFLGGPQFVVAATSHRIPSQVSALTGSERDVCRLIAKGMHRKQIARELRLALVTVEKHAHSAMEKLGCQSATDLAVFCAIHFCEDYFH